MPKTAAIRSSSREGRFAMKLATYRLHVEDRARLGVVVDGFMIDVERLGIAAGETMASSMLDLIDAGPHALNRLHDMLSDSQLTNRPGVSIPESNAALLAPIPRPRTNIWGIGLNYVAHAAESHSALDTAEEMPDEPVIFSKPPNTVIGPEGAIRHNPAVTQQLDWEVELAAIVGKRASRVSVDEALDYVFGYTVLVDISARDCRRAGQWIVSKGQDTFAPMGPWIVTADEIPDPQTLDLSLSKNGEMKQSANTSLMYFKVAELIADISGVMTLEPGDIIATGTPAGVGAGRVPQEWLWPGDRIVATVEGIGSISNPVVGVG